MKLLFPYFAVGAAGFFGSVARFAVGKCIGQWFNLRFPLGTFFINITGSLFLGWFLTFTRDRYPVSDTMRLAIGVGFVGAYTTFSTLMYESFTLIDEAAGLEAIVNLIGSLVLGMLAMWLGIGLGRRA